MANWKGFAWNVKGIKTMAVMTLWYLIPVYKQV